MEAIVVRVVQTGRAEVTLQSGWPVVCDQCEDRGDFSVVKKGQRWSRVRMGGEEEGGSGTKAGGEGDESLIRRLDTKWPHPRPRPLLPLPRELPLRCAALVMQELARASNPQVLARTGMQSEQYKIKRHTKNKTAVLSVCVGPKRASSEQRRRVCRVGGVPLILVRLSIKAQHSSRPWIFFYSPLPRSQRPDPSPAPPGNHHPLEITHSRAHF